METATMERAQLGRYQVERTLGAGGMGVVYLARDTRLHRPVAIKQLRSDATSQSAGARIRSEAQLLAQLNHPNIVQLYDVLDEDGDIALVMEYVEGTTLQEWMREHRSTLREKLDLLMQICRGLSEAHSLGIIHRDLKPDNILIARSANGRCTAKITDFGIAKSLQEDSTDITREDHVAGTVEAMSPEQLRGTALCPRSDLFSLGTIAYQLLCGAKPFEKGDGGSLALAQKVINEPHIPPQQANPRLPEPVATLLDRLLHKDPDDRPESAQQVYKALDFLYRNQPDGADTQEFSATVTQLLRKPPSQRRHTVRALAGAAGFAAVCVAGYFGWQYATRLEPQYIAVLPVEIDGEVRGEENAKELTETMVRQALMSATGQLKSSALVGFSPKEGQDLDTQLQVLRDKGVTDVLSAQLTCAQVRCEIELQRLGATDSQIKQQNSFTFLADKRQESGYRIANAAAHLFERGYLKSADAQSLMKDEDYKLYLDIVARSESKDLTANDLQSLEDLVLRYPDNINLYSAYTNATTSLYVASDNSDYIRSGLAMIERANLRGVDEATTLELELWLRTYDADKNAFDKVLPRLQELNYPPAALLNKYARFLFMQGEYEAGVRYARQASELNPSAENLYLVAINQFGGGDYQQAVATLTELTSTFPEHWPSYSVLGAIEIESGNYEAAEAAINSIPPKLRNWRTLSNLGVAYFLQGKYSQALTTYQEVARLAPDDIATIGLIAETQLMLGNEAQAQQSFQNLFQVTSERQNLEAKRYHALASAYLGKDSEAVALAHELNQEAPGDTDVKYASAQIYALAGEYRSASYHIEQLLEQGMGADWFALPVFRQLCTQSGTSQKVFDVLCN